MFNRLFEEMFYLPIQPGVKATKATIPTTTATSKKWKYFDK